MEPVDKFQTPVQGRKTSVQHFSTQTRPLSSNVPTNSNHIRPHNSPNLFNSASIQPQYLPVKYARTNRLYQWNLSLNHANTDCIRRTLKMHGHPDAGRLSASVVTCSACKLAKLTRAPHRRTVHSAQPGHTLCTNIAGPIEPSGALVERYLTTFTDLATRFTFLYRYAKIVRQCIP